MSDTQSAPIAILGAGLSGLSLAVALRRAGVRTPLMLIDRRRSWERDRTWCTWLTGPLRFSELASHRWGSWRLAGASAEVLARSRRHPYIHIDGATLYDAALAELAGAPDVTIHTGEAVIDVRDEGELVRIQTAAGIREARLAFDAMGPGSPLVRGRSPGATELHQRFLGWEVECGAPVFDPHTVTLMDFRTAQPDCLVFMYVLPFSPTRALIEHTTIGTGTVGAQERREALREELSERHGVREWELRREERGAILMSSYAFPLHRGPRVHAIGAAAGAVRPSSGYAFSRIQRHVDRVASAVAEARPLPPAVAPARFELLDRIFLRALTDRHGHSDALLLRLAQSLPADAFARFMTDRSTPVDEARVMAILPKRRMIEAALGTAASPARLQEVLRAAR